MNTGTVGGGINGNCCVWQLVGLGHPERFYAVSNATNATSRASSKSCRCGLRYLKNGEFRMGRETLRERDDWTQLTPKLVKPSSAVIPVSKGARRSRWRVHTGLYLQVCLTGKRTSPGAKWIAGQEMVMADPFLYKGGLTGAWPFSDVQMDDYRLGIWIAEQGEAQGLDGSEHVEGACGTTEGLITTAVGVTNSHPNQ